jgi:hypothetical protein
MYVVTKLILKTSIAFAPPLQFTTPKAFRNLNYHRSLVMVVPKSQIHFNCWTQHMCLINMDKSFQIGILFHILSKIYPSRNIFKYEQMMQENKTLIFGMFWLIQFQCLIQNILCWSPRFTNCHHSFIVPNKFGNVMFNHTPHFVSRNLASHLAPQVGWFWL